MVRLCYVTFTTRWLKLRYWQFLFTDHGAQQAIDIEIHRLLVNIQELKHLRNTHSAINKLPIDILSLILVESKRADFYSEKQTWKGLLGVCRRWRDILLAFPGFWSMINLENECCPLQEVLQRSGRCSLSVVAPLGGCGEKSFETVLLEVKRFKDLSVTFHPMPLSPPFDGLSISSTSASTSAPSLQVLTLRAHISHTVTIPNHLPFFSVSLTVLRLQDVTFQPEIPILPSLRKLIAVGYWSRNELTISWITTVLRRTPNIEEARFWGICAGHDDDTPNHPFITLPRLKRINIASQEVSDSSLFRYLSFPKSAIITSLYQNDFEERIYQSSQHFHSLISWLTSDSDAISYEEMRIIRAEDQRESTYFHLELLSPNSQMSEPALCLGLPYDPAAQEVYRRLCTCIPLSHVTEVTFSQFHPLEEEWSEFFFRSRKPRDPFA
ncbi:hypothetical protein ONZ45_g3517 [Pleurotus djamor]|nr:hypothetical protein ONZ45_g3517 [Pleurotus djamor]